MIEFIDLTPENLEDYLKEILLIEHDLFLGESPWSARAFIEEVNSAETKYWVTMLDNQIIGYAGVLLGIESDIHTIAIKREHQGKGYGKKLLELMLNLVDSKSDVCFLEVKSDNLPAINLYQNFGFIGLGTRKGYYAPGIDALTMRRDSEGLSDK